VKYRQLHYPPFVMELTCWFWYLVTVEKRFGFAESRERKHRCPSGEASSDASNPKHGL